MLVTHVSYPLTGMLVRMKPYGGKHSSMQRHPTQQGHGHMEVYVCSCCLGDDVCLSMRCTYPHTPYTLYPRIHSGILMETLDHYPDVGPSWTNHGSIAKYKGRWFLFYHTTALSNGHDKRRSVSIEYLTFGDDGSILVGVCGRILCPICILYPICIEYLSQTHNHHRQWSPPLRVLGQLPSTAPSITTEAHCTYLS